MARFAFNAPAAAAQADTKFEKAAAFLNIYLPIEGGQAKIGAIALRAGNADEAKLLAWLKSGNLIEVKDTATGEVEKFTPVEYLQQALVVDFREVRTEAHKFALPGM